MMSLFISLLLIGILFSLWIIEIKGIFKAELYDLETEKILKKLKGK